ncbi:MAG TPA: hypothetical protein VEV39_15615 [Gemmatimonadales bacterium]|nr:hypothetical protein [Gemmatimonadales bacterium]
MTLLRPLALVMGIAGTAALAYSCSSKGSTNPPPPTTYTISKVSGDSQVGSATAALGANLVVLVVDQNSAPAAGQTVTWTAASGGGSVTSGTSQTDANGHATMGRTLGASAGFQTTTASLSGATGSPITFTSISQIGGAFSLSAGPGGGQSDTVLGTLATPFQFLVKDHAGAPVSGVIVSFTALDGGGLSQTVDTSDAGGIVSTTLTLPSTTGVKAVQALVNGLVGSPVSLSATATAGHPTSIALAQGDAQAAPVSTQLPIDLGVRIQDSHGNGVSGLTVNWTFGGGGSLSGASSQSDGSGVAVVQRTEGPSVGVGHDTATATGVPGSPIAFTDTSVAVFDLTVHDDFYSPKFDTVAVGSFVRFTWAGAVGHSVTWDSGPGTLPSSSPVQVTGTLVSRLKQTGTYSYHCVIHGTPGAGMFGTIHAQ